MRRPTSHVVEFHTNVAALPSEVIEKVFMKRKKLKFMLDPFKADVYSIGVMMMECIWVNIQISDNQVGDLKAVFCIPEVVNLDHFLHVCELKHKQHNLFLSIIQNSPETFGV